MKRSFTWMYSGLLGEIKKQAYEGICWAIMSAWSIEIKLRKKNPDAVVEALSVQQLVDSVPPKNPNNESLERTAKSAFRWIVSTAGVTLDKFYPFVGYKHDQPLQLNLTKDQKVQIKGFVSIDDGDYARMAGAVLDMEPVLAAIYPIIPHEFWNHKSNVIYTQAHNNLQNAERIGHVVMIVGYDLDGEHGEGIPFWKCTTCWGTRWGVDGFARIAMTCKDGSPLLVRACYPVL